MKKWNRTPKKGSM